MASVTCDDSPNEVGEACWVGRAGVKRSVGKENHGHLVCCVLKAECGGCAAEVVANRTEDLDQVTWDDGGRKGH